MTTRGIRGYTIVELMMALSVLAIGVSGVIAMQKVTVASNRHAKNLVVATHIAESWADQLAADSARWNYPSYTNQLSNLANTTWLKETPSSNTAAAWIAPAYDTALQFGPAFDALGNPLPTAQYAQAVFFTHIRLSWVYPAGAASGYNGVIRADVRVFWPREGQGSAEALDAADPDEVSSAIENYHFVYKSTAVRQHTAFQ